MPSRSYSSSVFGAVFPVVDFEIYRRVEGSLEDPVQQLVALERSNDEPSEGPPALTVLWLSLLVDRQVDEKSPSQGEVRCGPPGASPST